MKDLQELEAIEKQREVQSDEQFLEFLHSKGFQDYEKLNEQIENLQDKLGLIIKEEKSPEEKFFLVGIPDDQLTDD